MLQNENRNEKKYCFLELIVFNTMITLMLKIDAYKAGTLKVTCVEHALTFPTVLGMHELCPLHTSVAFHAFFC